MGSAMHGGFQHLAHEAVDRMRADRRMVQAWRAAAARCGPQAGWYAAQTSGAADLVAEDLDDLGVKAMAPTMAALKRKPRSRELVTVRVPLFTRYLFVRLDPVMAAFAGVMTVRNVVALLGGTDGVPRAIPDAAMAEIIALTRAKPQPLSRRQMLIGGETVRVAAGPFIGLTGLALGAECAKGLVDVEIDVFGRLTPCRMGIDDLEIMA